MAIPAAPLTRAQLGASTERGLKRVYFNEFLNWLAEKDRIYNRVSSEKAQETDTVWAGLSTFGVYNEGGTPQIDNASQAYTKVFTALGYALGYKLTRWAMDDDLYGTVPKLMKDLARAAKYSQELLGMTPFNDSSATQYTADGTNYPLLSTTHFRLDGGTWSNKLSSGADLTLESLETLLIQAHSSTVDQRGNKVMVKPRILAVPVGYEILAERIVKSTQRPFTTDNDVNVSAVRGLDVQVFTHMTDDGRWYLLADKKDHSLQWIDRQDLDLQTETDGTATGNKIVMGSYRAAVGISHPIGIWGSL